MGCENRIIAAVRDDNGFDMALLSDVKTIFFLGADTMGCMHSDTQFAGLSSVPAHVEMMGLLGAGNNPMVGMTVIEYGIVKRNGNTNDPTQTYSITFLVQ